MTNQPDLRTALLTIRDASVPEAGLMAGVDTWSALVERLQKIAGDAVSEVGVRQDGDGLLPCPFCGGEADYYSSNEAVFRASWIGHIVHCKTCQARVQTSIGKKTAVAMWNNRRATPQPARDAAEGANVDACPICGINNNSPFPCEHVTAPPKPAPDAMRTAGIRLWNAAKAVALYRPLAKQVCHVPSALMHELIDALVFSSAPVPPADGAIDPSNHHNALKCPYCNPQGLSFAPSGTGAAEPVAWGRPHVEYSASRGQSRVEYWVSREDGKLIETGLVNPTVRGDRETEVIEYIEMAQSRLRAAMMGDEPCKPCIDLAASYLQEAASILSFHAQPGAGERDAVIMWLRSSLVSLMTLAEADPSPLTNKQVASICKVTLSRQAPHSSSEGGR